ncbi:DUF7312 domain-containing protein [Haloprofundus salilacus]|uniref:DUF7312 domain-containing protein n=1 Tax=Haloprofundus salilacus TaxID=2876190 RepID=UPI001CCDA2C4|nr:hypothetical protein [Haloprofundus salilacus]
MRDSHTAEREQNGDDDESEWRFGIDEVGEDAETADDGTDGRGEERELPPLEPESPSLENSLFVLLGIVGTLVFIFSVL